MIKQIFTLFIAISFSGVLLAQNTPQILSGNVKVVFPGKPDEQKLPTGGSMYLYAKDTSAGYMAMGLDLSGMGLSADMVSAMGDLLWDQLKGGLVSQMGGVVITKDQVTQFKGKNSLYLELDGTKSDNAQFRGKKAFGYLFFIGSVLHQVMYLSAAPDAKAENAQSFFDSVEIAK